MVVSVYHKQDNVGETVREDWPFRAKLVAVVGVDRVEDALPTTRSVVGNWTNNDNLLWVDRDYETEARSTTIGDFLVDNDGKIYMVTGGTLEEIVPAPLESFQYNGKDHNTV